MPHQGCKFPPGFNHPDDKASGGKRESVVLARKPGDISFSRAKTSIIFNGDNNGAKRCGKLGRVSSVKNRFKIMRTLVSGGQT